MKKLNPAVRNVIIFILSLLVMAAIYFYLRHGSTMHQGISESMTRKMKTSASSDYIRYFGQVPDVGMIECEGLVIYYPVKGERSFLPYPFFVTTPEKKEELIAKTMLSGLPAKPMGDYVVPIFSGLGELERIQMRGDTLSLSIKAMAYGNMEDLSRTARAFLLTYKQFDNSIERVILDAGENLRVEETTSNISIKEPGPPVLLDAFLVREEGEEEPDEVRLIFDRPMMIESLEIVKSDGGKIKGKVYLAEFSMAGIFKTEGPVPIEKGETFRVIYEIHDYLGRNSEGDPTFSARVEFHSG